MTEDLRERGGAVEVARRVMLRYETNASSAPSDAAGEAGTLEPLLLPGGTVATR